MRLTRAKILNQQELSLAYYRMTLDAPEIAREAMPGQFLHLRVSEGPDPLLRRPFSIHRVRRQKTEDRGQIEILYEVVGRGTQLLSKKRIGEALDIIGPLGQGFQLPITSYQLPILLVAGGIGVAPLLFLAEELITNYQLPVTILLGTKTKEEVLCEEEFEELGAEVKIATEDGTLGHRGLVTDLLSTLYSLLSPIYACGPTPMLKEVARLAKKHDLSAQISLEAHMACGVGACLGCAKKIKDKEQDSKRFIQICIKGPVFEANEVVWDE